MTAFPTIAFPHDDILQGCRPVERVRSARQRPADPIADAFRRRQVSCPDHHASQCSGVGQVVAGKCQVKWSVEQAHDCS